MVDENGVQIFVEELLRNSPFELVEPEIQELQRRQMEDHCRELPGEPVIAQIEFEEKLELLKPVRYGATEPVRVYMEQSQICQQAKLFRQIPGDVGVVEVDSGNCTDPRVVERRSTENSGVVADVGSDPVVGEIERIRENGLFPSLESYVGTSESRVFEGQRRVDGDILSAVAELVAVVQELPLSDEPDFMVGERAVGSDGERMRETH